MANRPAQNINSTGDIAKDAVHLEPSAKSIRDILRIEDSPDQTDFDEEKPKVRPDAVPKFRWYTWAIARDQRGNNYKRFITVSLRELLIFSLFLFFLLYVGLDTLHLYKNIYCQIVMNVLTKTLYSSNASISAVTPTTSTFYSIKTVPEIWTYLNHHLLNVLYFYNIEEKLSVEMAKDNPLMVLYENILIGPPRLRQVRVRSNSCKVPKMFSPWYSKCFDYYSYMKEDRRSYGSGSGPAWGWRSSPGTLWYAGKVSSFSPGGYYVDFSRKYNLTNITIVELQNHDWIDRGTRAVFVDFVVYTPNTNLFAVVKLLMETPPGGGVIPSSSCYSMKLIRLYDTMGVMLFVLEILLLLFLAYFILVLCINFIYFGRSYLCNFWGSLDVSIILILILLIILDIIKEITLNVKLPPMIKAIDEDRHVSFDTLAAVQKSYNVTFGIIFVVCWIKMVKYFSFCRTIALFSTTIQKSIFRITGLITMSCVILIGMSIAGHAFFGQNEDEFNTISSSMFSLLTIPVGGLNFFEETEYHSSALAPVFLAMFIFIFILIIFSLFIAVLVYGFERAEEYQIVFGPRRKYGFFEYLIHFAIVLLKLIRSKRCVRKLERKEKAIEVKRDYELVLNILARHGLRGEELKLFLEKHNINETDAVTDEQLLRMYKDLKMRKLLEKEVTTHDDLMKQIQILRTKFDTIERNLTEMSSQISHLTNRVVVEPGRKKTI